MKKTLLLVTSFLFTLNVLSQVGIGTTNIQNGVELQIESNSREIYTCSVCISSICREMYVSEMQVHALLTNRKQF